MRRFTALLVLSALTSAARAEVDPLPAALAAAAQAEGGGMPVGEPVRVATSRGDFAAGLSATTCYIVAAAAGMGVRKITLVLAAPDGKRVGEQSKRAPEAKRPPPLVGHTPPTWSASLRHCASFSGPYQVQVHLEGRGPALAATYVLSTAPPAAPAPMPLVQAPSPYPPPPVRVAPIVEVQVPAPVVIVNGRRRGQAPCRFSTDCGFGEFCKENSDGDRVCMGRGRHGDSCQSSIDCGPGAFCKPDSDGAHVCMSKGAAGQPCSSSIDCGFGLFCKDRGDDYLVCM